MGGGKESRVKWLGVSAMPQAPWGVWRGKGKKLSVQREGKREKEKEEGERKWNEMKIEKGRKKRKYEPKGPKGTQKKGLVFVFLPEKQVTWHLLFFFFYICLRWSVLYTFYTSSLRAWFYSCTGTWYLGPQGVNNLVKKSLVTRSLDLFWKLAVDLWGRRDIHSVWVPEWRSVINTCIPLSTLWGDPLQYWTSKSKSIFYTASSEMSGISALDPVQPKPNAC